MQHLQAYQVDTIIGNVSDAHDLVVVPVRLRSAVHQSSSSGEGAPAKPDLCDDSKKESEQRGQSSISGETAPAKRIRLTKAPLYEAAAEAARTLASS